MDFSRLGCKHKISQLLENQKIEKKHKYIFVLIK